MTKADLLVERGARRLQELADRAAARGDGVGEWLSEELRNDAEFLRKLKPSLIAARARGEAPTDEKPAEGRVAPSVPQLGRRPKPPGAEGGPSPWVIVGAAFALGILLAKIIDWRGHAHPRS